MEDIALVPLVTAIVQVVKKTAPKWLVPYIAMAIGVALVFVTMPQDMWSTAWPKAILTGVAIGLTSCGLYEVIKVPVVKALGPVPEETAI